MLGQEHFFIKPNMLRCDSSLDHSSQFSRQILLTVDELLNTVLGTTFDKHHELLFVEQHQNVVQLEECFLGQVVDLQMTASD